jgi:hypothetical protein
MFRHCVLMKFETDATDSQRATALDRIRALSDIIPEVLSLAVGTDAGLREGNFDLAVVADFENPEMYEIYASHPAHLEMLSTVVKPILAHRAAVQYEI